QPPDLPAGRRVVPIELAPAHDEELRPLLALPEERRGVRIALLRLRPRHAHGLPALPPRGLLVGDQVARGRLRMEVLQGVLHARRDHEVAPEEGAVRVAPPDRVAAVLLLEVPPP